MSQTAKSSAIQFLSAAGVALAVALLLGLLVFYTRAPQQRKGPAATEVAAEPGAVSKQEPPKQPVEVTVPSTELFKGDAVIDPVKRPSAPSATLTYQLDDGVSPPTVLYKTEPAYSQEAVRGKLQGDVMLSLVINEAGNPENVKVTHPLGMGLDERALKSVQQWHFRPANTPDDKPIAVKATIEVNFRLP